MWEPEKAMEEACGISFRRTQSRRAIDVKDKCYFTKSFFLNKDYVVKTS